MSSVNTNTPNKNRINAIVIPPSPRKDTRPENERSRYNKTAGMQAISTINCFFFRFSNSFINDIMLVSLCPFQAIKINSMVNVSYPPHDYVDGKRNKQSLDCYEHRYAGKSRIDKTLLLLMRLFGSHNNLLGWSVFCVKIRNHISIIFFFYLISTESIQNKEVNPVRKALLIIAIVILVLTPVAAYALATYSPARADIRYSGYQQELTQQQEADLQESYQ